MNDKEYVDSVELEGNIRIWENGFVARHKGTEKERGSKLLVEFMRKERTRTGGFIPRRKHE